MAFGKAAGLFTSKEAVTEAMAFLEAATAAAPGNTEDTVVTVFKHVGIKVTEVILALLLMITVDWMELKDKFTSSIQVQDMFKTSSYLLLSPAMGLDLPRMSAMSLSGLLMIC